MALSCAQALISAAHISINFLCRTLPFMIIGVIFAEFIVAMRFVDKIAFIARPIINFAHLSGECGASFVAAFFSPTSASSMLAAFRKDGRIGRGELFIASMVNSFPSTVMHWRAMLPVLIPLLGMAGIAYFSMLLLVSLVKMVMAMFVGRALLIKRDGAALNTSEKERPKVRDAVKVSIRNSKRIIKRIVFITIPTTLIVFTLQELGAFNILAHYLSDVGKWFPVPPEGLSVIVAQFGSYIAAATLAGNLLSTGVLTEKEVVITLLTGNVLASFLTFFRELMPYYVGIFGPKDGLQIMLLSTILRIGITLGVILILASWW